jgi:hypothetical protein
MKTVNWAMLYEKYKGWWVALDKDNETVVGAGTTPQLALDEAKAKGFEQAAITFVPQEVLAFAGFYETTIHDTSTRI